MEETSNPSGPSTAAGLAALLPEHLQESDDEDSAQLSSDFCGFNEELVQSVMEELYQEITREEPTPPSATEAPAAFLSVDVKDGSCELLLLETASTVMDGVNFVADTDGDGGGRSSEENVGPPAVRKGSAECGGNGFEGVQLTDEMGKWLGEVMDMDGCDEGSQDYGRLEIDFPETVTS